jgi:hypothetical protein
MKDLFIHCTWKFERIRQEREIKIVADPQMFDRPALHHKAKE